LYFKVKVNLGWLSQPLLEVLEKLKNENDLAIRGGVARLVLLESLQAQGKKISKPRIERERTHAKQDLDVILTHNENLSKAKEILLDRAKKIMEKDLPIPLMEDGFEPFQGDLANEKTIKRILATRDLTINEVILIPRDGQWWMYYTKRAWRDALLGIGMLNARDPTLTRRDLGRIVPTSRGFYRLLRAFIEGIVEKIWLPEWQVTAHLLEMARLQSLKKIPVGQNLGGYSLLIARRYKDSPVMQKRWMQVLRKLRFITLQSWQEFIAEQKLLEALTSNKKIKIDLATLIFNLGGEFAEEITLKEKIELLIQRNQRRKEARRERQLQRETCQHRFESIQCEGCRIRCWIQKCQKCTRVIFPNKTELPCNRIFIAGDWRTFKNSLISREDLMTKKAPNKPTQKSPLFFILKMENLEKIQFYPNKH
jgi:hypothetical protein